MQQMSQVNQELSPAAPACMGVRECQGQLREFLSCAPGFSSSAAVSVACVDVEYRVPCTYLAPGATKPAGRPGETVGAEARASAGACSDLHVGGQGQPGAPSESAATWQALRADTESVGAWPPLHCRSMLEQQAIPALDPGLRNSLLRLHDLRRLSQHQDDACPGSQLATSVRQRTAESPAFVTPHVAEQALWASSTKVLLRTWITRCWWAIRCAGRDVLCRRQLVRARLKQATRPRRRTCWRWPEALSACQAAHRSSRWLCRRQSHTAFSARSPLWRRRGSSCRYHSLCLHAWLVLAPATR